MGSKSIRSENANETTAALSDFPTSNGGVTREDLSTVVAELQQQMANQSTLMLEKLTALLAAQNGPAAQRVETGAEGNSHSSPPEENINVGDHLTRVDNDFHETNIEDHRTGVDNDLHHNPPNGDNLRAHNLGQQDNHPQWNRNPQNAGGTTGGAPPREEGSGPQSSLNDRLCKQAFKGQTGVCPVGPQSREEYISGMVRQIMRESMLREEDEKDWGFAPSKTPFTDRILKAEFPRRFTPPTIPAYSGTSDPNQFLYRYDWHMSGARATDELKCRYFPVYLEGVALLWFTKLPDRSVDQFSDLTKRFKDQFRLYVTMAKDIMSLTALEQSPGEPLKAFLNRFNTALVEVGNPEPLMILSHLVRAIDRTTKFGKWLKMKEPN